MQAVHFHPFQNHWIPTTTPITTNHHPPFSHIQSTQVVGDPEDRCTFTYDWGGGDVPPEHRCPHSM